MSDVNFEDVIEEYSFPCLYSNNSTENLNIDLNQTLLGQPLRPSFNLSTNAKKTASALAWNVEYFCSSFGINNIGFLTLTFKDHILDIKEAQRRFNSLATHVLRVRYKHYIRVVERQKSGRIHYHILIVLPFDIRTGFDFCAIEKHDYRTANHNLRSEWSYWRKTSSKYGFGRTELMPIKSNTEGIARYVGKYISKHMDERKVEDKGIRLVEYSKSAKIANTKFQFLSNGSSEWRRKVAIFASIVCSYHNLEPTMDNLKRVCGSRWAYYHREYILSLQ